MHALGRMLCGSLMFTLAMGPAAPARAGHPGYPPVHTIEADHLKGLLDQGARPVSVDLRSAAEHRLARLPGARSIPLDQLERRWAEVPRDRQVVLYCACATATLAPAYFFMLRQGYRDVVVLQGGVEAWITRGYPLER